MLPNFQLWDGKYLMLPKGSINTYLSDKKIMEA